MQVRNYIQTAVKCDSSCLQALARVRTSANRLKIFLVLLFASNQRSAFAYGFQVILKKTCTVPDRKQCKHVLKETMDSIKMAKRLITFPKLIHNINYIQDGRHTRGAILNDVIFLRNSPRSIYQNSNMTPRLQEQNCKCFLTPSSRNPQKRLEYQTKYSNMTIKKASESYQNFNISNVGYCKALKHSNNGLSVALSYCSSTTPEVLPVLVTLVFIIRVIKKIIRCIQNICICLSYIADVDKETCLQYEGKWQNFPSSLTRFPPSKYMHVRT